MIEQPNSYIRSLVRRYRSVATVVVPVTAKDGIKVVLKIVAITRERATHSRLRAIRKEIIEFVESYSKENGSDAIATAVIEGRLQGEMAAKVSHITQMSKIEVKKLEIAS